MKKILTILLATIIAMCVLGTVYAAPSPVPGDPMWKDTYVNDLKNVPAGKAVLSARTDASGDKIPSNAHSADYPGLYFYWNDQQKDDGVLLVNESVFDMFVGAKFTLTAKNSSTYWDWPIVKANGYQIEPGVYAYKIARNIMITDNKGKQTTEELKNINMVFIDGCYKDATVTIEKIWNDKTGNVITNQKLIDELNANLSFTNGFVLGNNAIKISAWAGKTVSFGENPINEYKLVDVKVNGVSVSDVNSAVSLSLKANDKATVVLTNQKQEYQPPGIIQLVKMVQRGNNAPIAWDSNNPDYVADNDNIWFDLYKGDINSQDKLASVHAVDGVVTFTNLVVGQEYTVKESFADPALADKYVAINPITTTAWAEDTTEHPSFTQVTPDPSAGVVNQRDVIISNINDPALKVYDCFNGYDNKQLILGANLDDENALWYNSMTSAVEPITPFWRSYMAGFSDFYANNLANLWLNPATQDYRPQFVWSTSDFTDPVKAVQGDTVIFEKEFTPLDQINGQTTLYATGDNAFLVYVNGQYAGKSDAVVHTPQSLGLTDELTAGNLAAIIGDRDDAYINTHNDMATWEKVYTFDITNKLIPGEKNTITIVGVNESKTTQGFDANPMKNPGGFIFGCEVNSQTDKLTFVNQLPSNDEGTLAVSAAVNLTYDEVTYVPVYETLFIPNDTTVSKSVYLFPNDNSGMRYVAVNVAAASSGDGVWFELADSSPSNRGLGLSYNVKIADGQLTVSFADGVVVPNDNIGILLSAKQFDSRPTSELKHDNVLTKALPAGTGDVVYLYLHSKGGIQYNGTKIVDWKEVSRVQKDGVYEGTLKLEITGPNDYSYTDENFDGNIGVVLDKLEPGDYTVTLSGDGFDPITQNVTVVKDETTTVPFSVDLQGPDVPIYQK
ncbi:MAG: PEGA domain-containing protein [Firmicutes bacterium]|nr:PEGA domain-containing protein [Bacillota bacterium]